MSIVLQGSTSGSVTLQEPAIAGTTVLDLPATSGTILTTASTGISASNITTGTLPAARLPAGSVLQVINMRTSTAISFSNTEQSTGLTASITPSSASNKILVIANNNGLQSYAGAGVSFYLYRGATFIYNFGSYYGYPSGFYGSGAHATFLDSPATTSSVTYDIRFQRTINGTGGVVNGDGSNSFLTLMEIAA